MVAQGRLPSLGGDAGGRGHPNCAFLGLLQLSLIPHPAVPSVSTLQQGRAAQRHTRAHFSNFSLCCFSPLGNLA